MHVNIGKQPVLTLSSLTSCCLLVALCCSRSLTHRQDNIEGLVQVGGAFAGSSAAMWQTKLSGVLNPYPALSNMFPTEVLAQMPTLPLETAVYSFSMGMPSGLVLLPNGMAEGPNHVLVQTPRRSYTVAQQKELLKDMGDDQAALLLDQAMADNKALMSAGPIPGVETYCVYGKAHATGAQCLLILEPAA